MSARVLFYRPPAGFTAPNGELIRRLQERLFASGHDPKGIDGQFGGNTMKALKAWQKAQGLPDTGEVDTDNWQRLMTVAPPSTVERVLQLTAAFEGTGFQKVCGNFDNAWLTWGIVGFTLSNGELDRILTDIDKNYPKLFDDAFRDLAKKMRQILAAPMAEQRAWANSISIGASKYRVEKEWEEAFARLGAFPEIQAVQLAETERYWKIARQQFADFHLQTEVGLSLMFDIAVQNGGLEPGEAKEAHQRIQKEHPADEREACAIIGEVVASHSNYSADVRSRKLTIAKGSGTVHGDNYLTDAWGLDDYPT